MKHFSHVLSAIDFSDMSLSALDRAGMIAKDKQAELVLFHGMNATLFKSWPRGFDPLLPALDQSIKSELLEKLNDLASQQRTKGARATSIALAESNDVSALVNEVKSRGVDLVVAGAHGSGYWHELFLGSFISKLIAHNSVPTLIVKTTKPTPYANVLIPVDFSNATNALIKQAQLIAPSAQKVLLHVVNTPHEGMMRLRNASQDQLSEYRKRCIEEAQSKLDALIAANQDGKTSGKVVDNGYPPGEIISFQKENQYDLVIIGKHGADYMSDLLVGSVTKLVMSHVSSDTLVVVG